MRGLTSAEERHIAAAGTAHRHGASTRPCRARVGARRAHAQGGRFRGRYGGRGHRHPPRRQRDRRQARRRAPARRRHLLVLAGPALPAAGARPPRLPRGLGRSTASAAARGEGALWVVIVIALLVVVERSGLLADPPRARSWPRSRSSPCGSCRPSRGARRGRPRRDHRDRGQLRARGRDRGERARRRPVAGAREPFAAFGTSALLLGIVLATMVADRAASRTTPRRS